MIDIRSCSLQLACTLFSIHMISCKTYDHAFSLLQNKTDSYERSLRPVTNLSSAVVVNTLFDIVSIQEFDEIKESLTIIGGLSLSWTDEFMTWNPIDYGGMEDIVTESGKFWMPNLVLVTNMKKLDKIGESWQRVRFTYQGVAFMIQADTFSTLCSVDVTYYPWDSHWCGFDFSSVAYAPSELTLKPVSDVRTIYLKKNSAWELIRSEVTTSYENATVSFRINLKRKPLFIVVNIILPIIALTFLNAVIFLIPVDSGERISYSLTVLLAVAVFLTLVGENLPKTSNPMPIFSFYLLTILLISVAITLTNIFSLRLYHRDNSESVSVCFETLIRWWQDKKGCKRNNSIVETINVSAFNRNNDTKEGGSLTDETDYQQTVPSEKRLDHDSDVCSELTWKDASVVFDKICFIIFNVILLIATFVFFMTICTRSG